ncbi:hypothetical protein GCM10010218_29850 [Streptomyces mashuensis]|uniref:Uncharacterized protein n=1 Tax=Streptomyces mashuensis TaxID=33904 RepID=A0A919B2T5_9ACTN|nr:hypothetical protein GCM10010218_29850 [Streptomyces mashuensis]
MQEPWDGCFCTVYEPWGPGPTGTAAALPSAGADAEGDEPEDAPDGVGEDFVPDEEFDEQAPRDRTRAAAVASAARRRGPIVMYAGLPARRCGQTGSPGRPEAFARRGCAPVPRPALL